MFNEKARYYSGAKHQPSYQTLNPLAHVEAAPQVDYFIAVAKVTPPSGAITSHPLTEIMISDPPLASDSIALHLLPFTLSPIIPTDLDAPRRSIRLERRLRRLVVAEGIAALPMTPRSLRSKSSYTPLDPTDRHISEEPAKRIPIAVPPLSPVTNADLRAESRSVKQLARRRKYDEKSRRWRNMVPAVALMTTLLLRGVGVAEELAHIDETVTNEYAWTNGASFSEQGPTKGEVANQTKTLIIVGHGWGEADANSISAAMMPGLKDPADTTTKVFGFVYPQHGKIDNGEYVFNFDPMYKVFDALLQKEQPEDIVFINQSMFDTVGLMFGKYFEDTYGSQSDYRFENGNHPRIILQVLDCSPLGEDDLREEKITQGKQANGLAKVAGTPGGAVVRGVAAYSAKQDQWLSWYGRPHNSTDKWVNVDGAAVNVTQVKTIYTWLGHAVILAGASNELLADQFNAITRFNSDVAFSAINKQTDVVQLRPDNASNDQTVNDASVTAKLLNYAAKYNLHTEIMYLKGTNHASEGQYPLIYIPALKAAIAEALRPRTPLVPLPSVSEPKTTQPPTITPYPETVITTTTKPTPVAELAGGGSDAKVTKPLATTTPTTPAN